MTEAYHLSKWSRFIRLRDGYICFLCEEDKDKQSFTTAKRVMHAHHIDPKSIVPEFRFRMENGVCLCNRCHHEIIHTTEDSWKKFRQIFLEYSTRPEVKDFNERAQQRL